MKEEDGSKTGEKGRKKKKEGNRKRWKKGEEGRTNDGSRRRGKKNRQLGKRVACVGLVVDDEDSALSTFGLSRFGRSWDGHGSGSSSHCALSVAGTLLTSGTRAAASALYSSKAASRSSTNSWTSGNDSQSALNPQWRPPS